MVCKAVLTFLVIGALSVNVSTIPVPVVTTPSSSHPGTPPLSPLETNVGSPVSHDSSHPITPPPADSHSPVDSHPTNTPSVSDASDAPKGSWQKTKDYTKTLFVKDPSKGLQDQLKDSAGRTIQYWIPSFASALFTGVAVQSLAHSGSTKTNSTTSNTKRDLGPDPPHLHIAARSLMDDHSRAPSHRPVPPKPQSQSESDDSDHSASIAVSKRGSVSEDEVADLPSSLLKRVPEPDPLRHSRPCVHPHGQAPGTPGPPRFKCEPRDWEEWGTNVGDRYANKYGPPDDAHH